MKKEKLKSKLEKLKTETGLLPAVKPIVITTSESQLKPFFKKTYVSRKKMKCYYGCGDDKVILYDLENSESRHYICEKHGDKIESMNKGKKEMSDKSEKSEKSDKSEKSEKSDKER